MTTSQSGGARLNEIFFLFMAGQIQLDYYVKFIPLHAITLKIT